MAGQKFFAGKFGDHAFLILVASVQVILHTAIHPDFGFHRDEFLYIDLGKHLDWGFLEVPPGIAVLAALSHWLFGESYFGYHVLPAVAGAGMVFLTGLMVKELGGSRFSQILAAVAVLISPAYIRSSVLFQPVVFEQLYFTLAAYLIIRSIRRLDHRLWIWVGIVMGIGLMNKYSMALFGVGIFGGCLLSPDRKVLLSKWPRLGAGLAIVIFLPNVIWEIQQGWPFFDHWRKLQETQFVHVSPLGFLIGQLLMNLISIPLWLAGLYFFLVSTGGRPYRIMGFAFVITLMVLLVTHGKDYYLLPMYPMLIAGGSFALGNLTFWNFRRQAISLVLLIALSLPLMPYAIPVLSITASQEYFGWMADHAGLEGPLRWEDNSRHALPQDYADMLGWEDIVRTTANVYHAIPEAERAETVIFGSSYAFTGAINYYRKTYDLPNAIGFNGSYYLWGPGKSDCRTILTVGVPKRDAEKYCKQVELAATYTHAHAREDSLPILICREPNITLAKLWPVMIGSRY